LFALKDNGRHTIQIIYYSYLTIKHPENPQRILGWEPPVSVYIAAKNMSISLFGYPLISTTEESYEIKSVLPRETTLGKLLILFLYALL
jgi:hypothetical protein